MDAAAIAVATEIDIGLAVVINENAGVKEPHVLRRLHAGCAVRDEMFAERIGERADGAAAGHHGVESVMEHLGTDKFWRFRLGIGTSHDKEHAIGRQDIRDAKEYVLDTFTGSEQGKARDLIKRGVQAIETALTKDIETAMNRFNS